MTDKKIIIDGVDVKECIFYIDHNPPEGSGTWGGAIHKGACKLNSTACKHTPQCFIKRLYKQLKRKEQECEELKKEKAEIKKYLGISSKTIMQRLEELQERKDKLSVQEYNYKQTLDEIEKIVSADYYDDSWGTLAIKIDSIKEIINKAKEA